MRRSTALAAILGCIAGLAAGWWLRPAPEPTPLEHMLERAADGEGPILKVSDMGSVSREPGDWAHQIESIEAGMRVRGREQIAWLVALDPRRFAWIDDPYHVRALDLSRLTLSAADVEKLKVFANLRQLNLRGTGIGDEALQHLEGFEHLVDLDLTGTLVGDAGIWDFDAPESLRRLALSGTRVTDEGMDDVADFVGLTDLSLEHLPITGKGLAALKDLPLKALAIGATQVDDQAMQHLDAWKLEHLSLYRNARLSDEGLRHLRNQPALESLMIRGLKVGEAGVAHLADLKKLRVLNASLVMDDASLVHLRDLHSLERLGLYSCPGITDKGVAHLEGLANLRFLQLQFTKTGDDGLARLAGLKHLRFLDLRGTPVSDEAHAAFVKDHPDCRVLR